MALAFACAFAWGCDAPEPELPKPRRPQRNVVLITIDTLRADHLHSYGFPFETSPQIDAMAERGVLFENAIAAASYTAPSHASIMTSRYVREHSIGAGNGDTRLVGSTTLAERFRTAGFDTAAFVGNYVLRPVIALDRGFDVYDADLPQSELNRPHFFERNAEATTRRALEWLAAERARPFFLWVHYQDPHGPYTPPPEWAERFPELPTVPERELEALPSDGGVGGIPRYQQLEGVSRPRHYAGLYAAEIAYADHWIGRLVAAAEARGAADADPRGSVVLLTADHGESVGEDGFYFQHGQSTTPEQARSPFVLLAPELAPARRSETVHHVDVMPTLLELAGLDPEPGASGLSLAPYLETRAPKEPGAAIPERLVFCDIGRETGAYRGDRYWRVRGSVKLWSDWAAGRSEATGAPPDSLLIIDAYQRRDPGLEGWSPLPGKVALPEALREYLLKQTDRAEIPNLGAEDAARLRALGYSADE